MDKEIMLITKKWLRENKACSDGYDWAVPILKKGMPLNRFVKKFKRADWLVWTLNKAGKLTHRQNVLLACMYARASLHRVPKGEDRPRLAIEAAEAWVENSSAASNAERAASDTANVAKAAMAANVARADARAAMAVSATKAIASDARAASVARAAMAARAVRAASDARAAMWAAWAASAAASAVSAVSAASDAAWAAKTAQWAVAHKQLVKDTLERLDAWGVLKPDGEREESK